MTTAAEQRQADNRRTQPATTSRAERMAAAQHQRSLQPEMRRAYLEHGHIARDDDHDTRTAQRNPR